MYCMYTVSTANPLSTPVRLFLTQLNQTVREREREREIEITFTRLPCTGAIHVHSSHAAGEAPAWKRRLSMFAVRDGVLPPVSSVRIQ